MRKIGPRELTLLLAGCAVAGLFGLWRVAVRHPRVTVRAAVTAAAVPPPLAGVTVILDPGHGGADPGAVRGGLSEAAVTYRAAAEIAARLTGQGAQVCFTVQSRMLSPTLAQAEPPVEIPRDATLAATGQPLRFRRRDSPVLLWQRARLARQVWDRHAGDPRAARRVFFLSLHLDDFHGRQVRGGLVCVDRRTHHVPDFARQLAHILTVQGWDRRHCSYHKIPSLAASDLGVLNPHHNPVPERALLEMATLSNVDDRGRVDDPNWRHVLADQIAAAVLAVSRS